MGLETKQKGDWIYYYFPELEGKNICHGFFTKRSPSHKISGEEKDKFLKTFNLRDIVIMSQEHGDRINIISEGERPGSGDGITLIEKGVAGIIKTADCLPVIIAEPDYPMVSIIHAGWRGTAAKIVHKTIEKMVAMGAKKKYMTAILGPSIRACCYKVGQDLYTEFQNKGFSENIFQKAEGSLFLDIAMANREIIENTGIKNIFDTGLCTFCNKDLFYSYRANELEKRQINFAYLME